MPVLSCTARTVARFQVGIGARRRPSKCEKAQEPISFRARNAYLDCIKVYILIEIKTRYLIQNMAI